MFYRDGKGQAQPQPFTWAEFLEHLGRRVQAADQPSLVRAKYGVGLPLEGGDMPEWAFNPEQVSTAAEFRHENGQAVLVPAAMITGTLDRDETRRYKERLAELVIRGEDQPLGTLPAEALAALHHLGLLDPRVQTADTQDPQVQQALHDFRRQVGKDEPDDPEHAGQLMPAERVALELYEQRIARYAALQAGQKAAMGDALDVLRVRKLPARFQRTAAPYVAAVQTALADRGLLTQPTQKTVWRDKKRKKHTSYKTVPFAGKPDKATVAALNTFQLRHGLRRTDGVADAVTLEALGLPPMGLEVFLPPSGPRCAIEGDADAAPLCEVPARPSWGTLGVFSPNRLRALPRILDGRPGPGGGEPPAGSNGSDVGDCETHAAI
jgi:peptidoglycan hydrolase-like protein with peptidoglycan-binding domain